MEGEAARTRVSRRQEPQVNVPRFGLLRPPGGLREPGALASPVPSRARCPREPSHFTIADVSPQTAPEISP